MLSLFRIACIGGVLASVSAQTSQPYPPLLDPPSVDGISMEPGYVSFPPIPATTTAGSLSVNSSGLIAQTNQTVTFSASLPATWALAPGSVGTLKVIDSMHASYTAPASIPSQSNYGGCTVSPNDALWNVDISKLPVHPLSGTWTVAPNTTTNTLKASADFGIAFADENTPVYPMTYYYTTANNNSAVPIPNPPNERQHGSLDASNNDHHTITVRTSDCTWHETYNYAPDHKPYLCRDGTTRCTAQSGISYAWSSQKNWGQYGATDAAGMPLKPLVPSAAEIRQGIHHAMRFVLPQGFIQKGGALWPSFSGNGWGGATTAPYGARMRLKAAYNISTFSPMAQNILRAMQQYGLFLADAYPGGFGFTVSHDVVADRAAMSAVGAVTNKLHMSDFEYVDESSLVVGSNTYLANWNNPSGTVPVGAASLVITDAAVPTSVVRLPIELQPVLVGVKETHMNVVAGTSNPFPIPYWITGTTNTSVSITTTLGSISDTLIYTPPPSVSVPTEGTITIRSAADPSAFATIYLTVFPASANGSFRVDFGATANTKDGKGQSWWNDGGLLTGIYVALAGDYPSWSGIPASGLAARAQIQSTGYTYGDDLRYVIYGLRDGNYYLHLWFGLPYQGCAVGGDITKCADANPDWHSHIDILATGTDGAIHTVQANYNFETAVNLKHGVATDVMLPVNVVNGRFEVALVADNPTHGTKIAPSPLLNGMEILPALAPAVKK